MRAADVFASPSTRRRFDITFAEGTGSVLKINDCTQKRCDVDDRTGLCEHSTCSLHFRTDRGVSPVVGTVLLLVILFLLIGVISVGLLGFGADLSADPFERAVDGQPESSNTEAPYAYRDNITAVDNRTEATTEHIVTLNVTGNAVGNSLNQVTVDYTGGQTDVSETATGSDLDHLLVIGIDTSGNGQIDTDAMDDVERSDFDAEDDGSRLVIELTGNYDLNADDKLVIVYEAVTNPSATGTYAAEIDLNGDRVYNGTLSIS